MSAATPTTPMYRRATPRRCANGRRWEWLFDIVVPANAGAGRDCVILYRRPGGTPGPMIPGVRDRQRKMTSSLSEHSGHGDAMSAMALTLGVPAFAGTTPNVVSAPPS